MPAYKHAHTHTEQEKDMQYYMLMMKFAILKQKQLRLLRPSMHFISTLHHMCKVYGFITVMLMYDHWLC